MPGKEPVGVRVVTRADDLGSFSTANRAIMDAYKKGVLRNASVIVPASHFDEAAEMFAPEKEFCVGLHSCVTSEWDNARWKPLLAADKVASIVGPDGSFKRHARQIQEGGVRFDQMLAEIQAQLDLARRKGLDIKYVDTHMAFGWLFEDTDEHRFCDPMRRWAEKEGLIWAGWGNKLEFGRLLRPEEVGNDPLAQLAQAIREAKPGDYLLVTHPMYDDEEARKATHGSKEPGEVAKSRDMQRRMFMDPVITEAFAQSRAVPIRYTDM